MTKSTDAQKKRLAELKKEVIKRGFDRHAYTLNNLLDLPADLQSPAVTALASCEEIQTVVVFPPQIQRGWHYVPKQALLFTATGLTHLFASIWPDEGPQVTTLNACGLMYLKVTLLLLYGYLEIVGQGQDSTTRLGMEFNTVAWSRLSQPLRQLLNATKTVFSIPPVQVIYSPNVRQAMEKLPFKFSNGIKIYGLLPGEQLEELVFQSGTWKLWLYFFRRPATADTLLMLTTNYLVAIQEDLNVRQGWIISYIPRNCICGIQSQPHPAGCELTIQLKRECQSVDYKILLSSEAVETWRRQWTQHGGQWENLPEQNTYRLRGLVAPRDRNLN